MLTPEERSRRKLLEEAATAVSHVGQELHTLNRLVDQLVQPIGQSQPSQDNTTPAIPLPAIRTVTEFSDSHNSQEQAEQDRTYRLQRGGFAVQILLFVATAAAFVAAWRYADIADHQWQTMNMQLGTMNESVMETRQQIRMSAEQSEQSDQRSRDALAETKAANATNREALIAVQRAFVVFRQTMLQNAIIDASTKKIVEWEFLPILENTGTTPTRSLSHHTNFRWTTSAMPADFAFSDLLSEGSAKKDYPFVIAPKDSVSGADLTIPEAVIDLVSRHAMHLYFWGWAMYRDVFEKTPMHVSMFCTELAEVRGDPQSPQFLWTQCQHHNCTDNDCDGEKGDPRKSIRQPVTP